MAWNSKSNDITAAIKNIANTSIAHIGSNCILKKPNVGNWTSFSYAQIQKFVKRPLDMTEFHYQVAE
ncbi:hypothetical protein RclHR1_16640001 [Rhizophagus clarus]|uniref:Uncharacterized protein n=1 Tax=Rhizophagus clarus TaxID=94130 RepID=A0A2Z6QYP1_9GLOM|nr:hypothetical protein RclHR1_16640001 [Rhizophagus clarus]